MRIPPPPPPLPQPGFVFVRHDGLDADAEIPEVALALHRARGWRLADDEPENKDSQL